MPLLARPGVRRTLGGLALALVVFGVGMLIYPVTTDIYTSRAQAGLRREFAARVARALAPAVGEPAIQGGPGPEPAPFPPVGAGQGAALIRIPKLGVDAVMVEGADPAALRKGPGHYPGTPPPCAPGNVAIAGHRTTYGRAFSGLDLLGAGDQITLVTPRQRCTYEVVSGASPRPPAHAGSAAWITSPRDWTAVAPLMGSYLTLTTCHPRGSATQRLIVRARLVSGMPSSP